MNVFQLQCFISVRNHLSFTKAAEDCHVVQATVSRQISMLEEELGVRLFARDSHGVRITSAGEMLAHYAPSFIEYQKVIAQRVSNASSYDLNLRIGVGPYEHLLLRGNLKTFHQSFPNAGIDLTAYTYYVLMTRYRNNVLDLALCSESCAAQMTDYTPVEICSGNWKVAAARDSRLWTLAGHSIENEMIITLVDDQYDHVRKYCYEVFEKPRMIETNFLTTLLEMVEAGLGAAILPPFIEPYLPKGVVMKDILEIPFSDKFYAMVAPGQERPEIDFLVNLWQVCKEKKY